MLGRDSEQGRLVAGRYRLLSALGTGGTGTVWRAQDVLLARDVAVKEVLLPPGLSEPEREDLRERTRREARSAARLASPHAVTVYDVVEQDGSPFLVMELVEARTLAEVVRADGPLPAGRAAAVGLALLGALEEAHGHGIVHRDVKPGNVLVRPDGRVVLTDFGIAQRLGEASITGTGLLLGSPSYIAPERARGEAPGPASDLWSLGATLFTAVEGRPPYDAGDPIRTMTAVVQGEHAPFVAAGPLEPVIRGLLARDPATRLDAAGARPLLQAVVAAGQHRPAGPAPTAAVPGAVMASVGAPTTAVAPVQPRVRRRRTGPLVLAGLALLAVLGVTAALLSGSPASRPTPAAPLAAPTGSVPGPVYRAAAGWSVALPTGWEPGTFKGTPQLRNPDGRVLRVDTSPLGGDVEAAVRDTAAGFRRRHPSYAELALTPDGSGRVVWEFTYRDSGTDLHAAVTSFRAGDRSYALMLQTHADDWTASAPVRARLLSSFHAAR